MINSFYEQYVIMETDFSESVAYRWVNSDGESVCSRTYGEYCADIRRYAAYLKDKLGELAGKHVAVLSQNSYDYYVIFYAGFLTNTVIVPMNYQKELSELLDEMERADISAVIVSPTVLEWLPELPEKYTGELMDISGYKEYPEAELEALTDLDRLGVIMYTSGTTGRSKGVMLSQKNLLYSFAYDLYNHYMDFYYRSTASGTGYFSVLPVFHVAGLRSLDFLFQRIAINICESPKYFYRDLSLMSSGSSALVPSFFNALFQDVRSGRRSRLGTMSLFYTLGANADLEALAYLIDNGYSIEQRYGLTESVGLGIKNISQDKKHISSIGQPENIVQVRLDDGELCLRGDTIFMGYYKDPESTAEVFDEDGWFHTGDLARVDEDGYYYITGRKKNLIILSSGENVSPEELENKLLANKNITEVIIKEKDNRIAAEIYCEKEKQPEIRDFVAELNKTLPTYKYIAETVFRDTPFERTSTGKIKR